MEVTVSERRVRSLIRWRKRRRESRVGIAESLEAPFEHQARLVAGEQPGGVRAQPVFERPQPLLQPESKRRHEDEVPHEEAESVAQADLHGTTP